MILGNVWKHQRTIYSCEGIKSCDFGPNAGLGIFLTDMIMGIYMILLIKGYNRSVSDF